MITSGIFSDFASGSGISPSKILLTNSVTLFLVQCCQCLAKQIKNSPDMDLDDGPTY
jgi:hypothetical protein